MSASIVNLYRAKLRSLYSLINYALKSDNLGKGNIVRRLHLSVQTAFKTELKTSVLN